MNTPTPVKAVTARPVKPDEQRVTAPPSHLTSSGQAKPKQKQKPVGLSTLKGTPEARKQAALILEVLGGVRGPSDAATAMGVAVPRYYMLETRALQGLIRAMEPLPRGPGKNPDREIIALHQQLTRQKQETVRVQSLLRALQRSMGLPALPPKDAKQEPGKRKPKRPSVRALKAVKVLRVGLEDVPAQAAVQAGQGAGS